MCTVCGCGSGELKINGQALPMRSATKPRTTAATRAWRALDAQAVRRDSATPAAAPGHLHFGQGPAHAHAPGLSQTEMVRIEQDILGKNNAFAAANRKLLAERGVFALNLVSSPGSGKTTLLVETIRRLAGRVPVAVIEGDQQTEFDAERAIDYARRVNPKLQVVRCSAISGAGFDDWLGWIEAGIAKTARNGDGDANR